MKVTREKEHSSVRIKINVLKKYSRAAGDRNQWTKVEAMSSEFVGSESESARESFERRGREVSRDDRINMRCQGARLFKADVNAMQLHPPTHVQKSIVYSRPVD